MDFSVRPDERMTSALKGLSSSRSLLKIVVKTRDELELTRSWIEHHAGIVGIENLLIADNASTMTEVLETYRSFGPALNWFSFVGHHNAVNMSTAFPQLYAALADSARFVAFLDMDERLLSLSENGWDAGDSLLQRLADSSADLISAPWLQNVHGRDDAFHFSEGQLEWGVRFGKPVLSTRNPFIGTRRFHTVQYPLDHAEFKGLGVLHLSHLSITQRLRTNKNKLIQRGVATPETTYQEIADISTTEDLPEPLVTRRCIEEIRQLVAQQVEDASRPGGEVPGEQVVTLGTHNDLLFGSRQAGDLLQDFLRNEQERSLRLLPKSPLYVP